MARGSVARHFISIIAVLSPLMASSCRDVDRFLQAPPEFPEEAGTIRLTYNQLDDRAPAFNPADQWVTYTASGYPPFALRRGLLLTVPPAGGRAALLLPQVQPPRDSTPWLIGPAFSLNGADVAFVELRNVVHMPRACDAGLVCPIDAPFSNVSAILTRGSLRVRSVRDVQEKVQLPLTFCCRTNTTPPNAQLEEITVVAHPYQQQFQRDSAQLFRPSWSPDGTRLVFSDGMDLYLLDVTSGDTTHIPNTRDGVWPAWSPDGTRIAFTRLFRGNAESATCTCYSASGGEAFPIGSWHITRHFDGGARVGILTLINVDGSSARNLGLGEAPAWLPDGSALIAQRENSLWRVNVATGDATEIAGTERGYEPAVSADGRWLVYSRRGAGGGDGVDHDIVTTRLE